MTFTEEFSQALRHQRMLMKHRPDRLRMRVLVYLLWLAGFGLFFATINGLQSGRLGSAGWWLNDVPGHMLVSACVTACFVIGFRGFERLAPQRWLDTIMGWRDWRSGVFFSVFSIACSLLGEIGRAHV